MDPEISFIVPVYNMEGSLGALVRDLFSLKGFPFQIIVVNDGSTDGTSKVIDGLKEEAEAFEDAVFVRIKSANKGRGSALNRGALAATGKYLSFMDADDRIDIDELLKLRNCIANEESDLVIGSFRIVTKRKKTAFLRKLSGNISRESLLRRIALAPIAPLHLNAALIKKELFERTGGFDETLILAQDKDLTIRLLRQAVKMKICNSAHYLYHKHDLKPSEKMEKRLGWFWFRQKVIWKNYRGMLRAGAMPVQFFWDMIKLGYEFATMIRKH